MASASAMASDQGQSGHGEPRPEHERGHNRRDKDRDPLGLQDHAGRHARAVWMRGPPRARRTHVNPISKAMPGRQGT